MSDFISDLKARSLIHSCTSDTLAAALARGPMTGYIGFDPTSDSLHVGSLLQIMTLRRFQKAGHRPIALVGGGTGLVGDPSGKESERTLLTDEVLEKNVAGLHAQLARFLDFSPGKALLLNNADWLRGVKLLDFLRDIGKHFSVNEMLRRDSVKDRLAGREHGISFTEFSYILLQSYDFLQLYDLHGCTLQMGGSDQWGNIVSGADLIRRLRGVEAFGLTSPLINRSDGKKFGKSESGNVWLDPKRTSPYEFYQFWLNTDDKDATPYLKAFTFLPLDVIEGLSRAAAANPAARETQKALAAEVTALVHGGDALARAKNATRVFFDPAANWRELSAQELQEAFQGAPSHALPADALGTDRAALVGLLADAGLYPSRGQARKDLPNGSVSINGQAVKDVEYRVSKEDVLPGGVIVLRKGKKTYMAIRVDGAA